MGPRAGNAIIRPFLSECGAGCQPAPQTTIVKSGQLSEPIAKGVRKCLLRETPFPVAARGGGGVHARNAREAEYILKRHDGRIGNRREHGPNERPVHFASAGVEIRFRKLALPLYVVETACAMAGARAVPPA